MTNRIPAPRWGEIDDNLLLALAQVYVDLDEELPVDLYSALTLRGIDPDEMEYSPGSDECIGGVQ
jgi:hypothetical protein